MKAQLIYSVAALATFPIVVNAQVNADNIGKITAKKDGTAWTKNIELAPGKYTFKSGISTGTAGKKATVSILDGTTPIVTDFDVTVGAAISKDFTLDAKTTVTIKVVSEVADADFIADESVVQLNFNFSKVAELLQIEYNKVTQVLAEAQYKGKADDAQTYSAYYDRVMAIANADYAFYKANTEGLQAIYNDQTQVSSGFTLYDNIAGALNDVKTKEVAYLDGSNGLNGLDARYNSLKNDFGISYVTTDLTASQTAAKSARDAFNSEPTAANLIDAKAKIEAYKKAIEKEEGVKTDNENANDYLKAELGKVFGDPTSYYATSLAQIATQYAGSRYADLKGQVEAALLAIVSGTDYTGVQTNIQNKYTAKESKAKKNDLINEIAAFKEKLTRVVSDYSTVRGQLAEVYVVYDAQDAAAKALVDGDASLKTYKDKVVAKVGDLLSFIEANDQFTTVANLTEAAIQPYLDAIVTATNTYNDQSGIYGDYQALKDAVVAQTTSLNDAKTAVDADAKDAKKLDETVFKPTTIWATTISAIESLITTLDGNVDTKRATANTYKNTDEYKNALKTIKDQIAAFKTNALAATAKYAEINTLVTETEALRAGLLDTSVEPLKDVDLTALNVWSNQVTIDDAVKARTPYKNFIADGTGSITTAIATLATKLADAPNKKVVLNNKKDNKTNILPYLNSLDLSVVTNGKATMNDIKANYTADNEKFDQQIVKQQCEGIITMINDKAVVFATSIKALQDKVDAAIPTMSNANKAKLQTEINAITAKIDAAKAVAAKAGATKDELTAAYNNIKDLATTDIKTAQDNLFTYEGSFTKSTGFYNTLKGGTTDPSTASTLNGLTKKVTEQKGYIGGLAKLTDTQKNTLKGKVDAVEVVKQEGAPAVDVTYNLTKIANDIEAAWQNETLDAGEQTRYQNIINDLKLETEKVKTQADRLNDLEDQLSQINFTTAANNIKAKDPNTDGFYLKKLLGNAAAGECTFDFNALKSTIEADDDITAAEVTTYGGQITALNTTVTGLAALAETNLNAWKDVKDAYSKDAVPSNPAIWGNGGAVQQYEAAMAKLEADFVTSKLEDQKMALATLKDALDASKNTAEANYNAGTATAADKTDLINKLTAIKNQWEEYTNEVNYNGQIAADNKAIWEAANAAHADADAQYAISSSIINTYKLFKSNELKAATEKAQTELQDLLTYLEGYDAKVAEIQGRVDNTYGKIVSPAKFDTEETFKAEFEAVKAELKTKTQTLSDKIKEYASEPVNASATTYTDAIDASKAKVVKFSATDADLTDVQMDAIFGTIDAMMKAINDNKDNDDKLKDLDKALVDAANTSTGIQSSILTAERNQASSALLGVISSYGDTNYYTNLSLFEYGDDYYSFRNIHRNANGYWWNDGYDRCISNFATYKQQLKDLKVKAEQNKADYTAINNAQNAINTANAALTTLGADYQTFAAGAQVKATIDQIAADLKNYPTSGVNATNAGEWKTAAEGISTRIANVYNDLFDAEVTVIEGLIAQAKEENLTYGGADKATISGYITTQEGYLTAAKEAVAKPDTDPAHKTKKEALKTITNSLKTIESALNGYILTMTTGNATNINDVVAGELNDKVGVQQSNAYNALNVLDYYASGNRYRDVNNSWKLYSSSALTADQSEILTSITNLSTYISNHYNEITAYRANVEAMLKDIETAITNLETKAQQEYDRQYNQFVQADQLAVESAWNTAEGYITTAQGNIDYMNAQLGHYKSASNYTNKVKKLEDQLSAANGILTTAQTEAESLTTLREKYVKATAAGTNINNALDGVAANSGNIIDMAKAAYINAFIDNLRSQVIADTWTNSSNYTATDKNTLKGKWNAIRAYVGYVVNDVETKGTLKTNAEGYSQAEILYHPTYGYETSAGVLATLERGETTFTEMLNDLKQAVKDMSLVEDVKGHVSGNDEISTDDLEDLADIILNAEEESADLSRCDISGDGTVDVTDLVWLRYFLVHDEWPNVAAAARGNMASANDYINMEVVSVENNVTRIAINLDNETVFNHFQLNVQLPEGAKVVSQTLGERVEGANLMMAQNGTTVRMLAISTANNVFAGNEGAVVYLNIEGLNGEVNIEKAIFTDTELNGHQLTTNSTTSIRESITNALQSAGQKIYNMGGKMMNGLKKGVNIIRNADGSAKKVMK